MSALSRRLAAVETERASLAAEYARGGFSDMERSAREHLLLKKRALIASIRAEMTREEKSA